jgi:hypothetical protein
MRVQLRQTNPAWIATHRYVPPTAPEISRAQVAGQRLGRHHG